MTEKIRVPLGITDDLKYMLESGEKYLSTSKGSIKQYERFIKELEEGIESGKEITTDYIEDHWKVDQYWFYFHLGKTDFKLLEDRQTKTTLLYAIDDYGENFGLFSLDGTQFNLEGYYIDALEVQEMLDNKK